MNNPECLHWIQSGTTKAIILSRIASNYWKCAMCEASHDVLH